MYPVCCKKIPSIHSNGFRQRCSILHKFSQNPIWNVASDFAFVNHNIFETNGQIDRPLLFAQYSTS